MDQREVIITIILGIFFVGHIVSCLSRAFKSPIKQILKVLPLIAGFVLACFAGKMNNIMSWTLVTLLLNIAKCLSAACAFIVCLDSIMHFGYHDD